MKILLTLAVILGGLLAPCPCQTDSSVIEDSTASYTIIVTATRREALLKNTPGIAYVVGKEQISALNARTAADVFKFVPGLDLEAGTGVGTPAKQTVSLNGTPSFHTLVLVDGKRLLSSHFHTGTDITLVPAGNIERIEVVKDAGSALYGSDAIGGVVNLITRKGGPSPAMSFTARRGTENTSGADLSVTGPLNKAVTHSLFTSWERSDGLPILSANSRSGQLGYTQLVLMDRIDCIINEKADFGVSLHYVEHQDLVQKGIGNYDDWLFSPGLTFNARLTENLSLSSAAYYSQWNADLSDEKHVIGAPSLWLTWSGHTKHLVMAGGEYNWRSLQRTGVERNSQRSGAAFLQDEYTPFGALKLLGAARMDYVDNGDNGSEDAGPVISPKISALYRPVDWMGIRAGVGRGFRAPSVQDLLESRYHAAGGGIWRYGSRSLTPEYSTNINGGVEVSPLKDLTLIGNGYFYRLTDMIALVGGGRDTVYKGKAYPVIERKNINNYNIQSVEVLANYRWNFLSLETGMCASWQKSDDPDGEEVLSYPGRNAFGKLAADLTFKRFAFKPYTGLNAVFSRKSPGGGDLGNYQNLQAGLSINYLRTFEIYVNGVNLLGEEMEVYEDALYTIEGQTRVEGGVRVNLK